MITKLTHTFIYVLELERAIEFYTQTMNFSIHADLIVNGDRWVTISLPEQPDLQILLVVVEEGMIFKSNRVKEMQSLLKNETLSFGVFECTNVRAMYEELRAKGVRFFIEPYLNPEFDIFEAAFFDDSGNWFRLTEKKKL